MCRTIRPSLHGAIHLVTVIPGVVAAALLVGCAPEGADDTVNTGANDASRQTPPAAASAPNQRAAAGPVVVARASPDGGAGNHANAHLMPTAGNNVTGTADFERQVDGTLRIRVTLEGLEQGSHGIHIHQIGDCSAPDGSSAGDHFAPDDNPHGSPDASNDAHHAGDLGNIVADASGAASQERLDDQLSLDGAYNIVGRALVVHAEPDDLVTQPSGESGDRVACGVILAEHASAPGLPPAATPPRR